VKFRGKELPLPAVITGAAGVLWLGSFGLRAIKPDLAIGPAADTLMATCVAWLAKTRLAKNGQDDLLSQVLTTSVLPFVSTAHADTDTPAPASPAPYTPKPTTYNPPPYTPPRPSTPPAPKPGGLPWS
jgi:hypothetical protein